MCLDEQWEIEVSGGPARSANSTLSTYTAAVLSERLCALVAAGQVFSLKRNNQF